MVSWIPGQVRRFSERLFKRACPTYKDEDPVTLLEQYQRLRLAWAVVLVGFVVVLFVNFQILQAESLV